VSMIVQMKNYSNKVIQILKLAHSSGVVSSKEVRSLGIHHEYLRQMCSQGELVRVERGMYSLPDADVTAHHGLAQAGKIVNSRMKDFYDLYVVERDFVFDGATLTRAIEATFKGRGDIPKISGITGKNLQFS